MGKGIGMYRPKGDMYLTLEILGDRLDASTSAGQSQQLEMEKQLAPLMLGHLG